MEALGPDGHTASLFPGTSVLAERQKWATAVYGKLEPHRLVTVGKMLLFADTAAADRTSPQTPRV
jgi:6-phosphogluconolactonase/glucosamine-6-phosphate isomerase/deaminase